jgi:iron complex outermembrane receptor protein
MTMPRPYFPFVLVLLFISGFLSSTAQKTISPADLKKLSVEELMNIRVTLVSRTPQRIRDAASAIQVMTGDEIKRSGAASIPDALRLFPNIQVAQLNSGAWIIGTRGFNTIFSNKLLVMIDGRTIYTPLFGGVIWDIQDVLLEDIDRIEVVSGPGGTLWGANAVNGVINIVTKKSSQTQGAFVSASAGNFLRDNFEARYGGKIGDKTHFRVYGMHFDRQPTTKADGNKSTDGWRLSQGGFRMDIDASPKDEFTVQGDFYGGTRKTAPEHSPMNGQNILGRWTHTYSSSSDILLQVYYDRYFREDVPGTGSDRMNTIDADFQHRINFKKNHELLWGLGYRFVRDYANFKTQNVAILPPKKSIDLFNGFIQDEISLSKRLKVTAGTKILHNVYTGVELQPSARAAFAVRKNHTLWAAISRAVRTPSRFDRDYFLPAYNVPPPNPSVAGGPDFESENLTAYEIGYRIQPNSASSFSVSTFYNVYTDLYSVEALPGTLTYQIMNGSEGKAWGFEITGAYQPAKIWTLRGGYTFFDKDLHAKAGHTFDPDYLGNDSKHSAVLQSILNLPFNLQFDVAARYKSKLEKTLATAEVPEFLMYDMRIAWVAKNIELSLIGQNLSKEEHTEFDVLKIPRSFYAKIAGRF